VPNKKSGKAGEAKEGPTEWGFFLPAALVGMVGKLASNPVAMSSLGAARWREMSRVFWGRSMPWGLGGEQVSLLGRAGAQTRSARLFMPDSAGPGAPIVVMLHGCLQDSSSFATLTRIDEIAALEGFNVLHPDQESSANPMLCWNWNAPQNQRREGGEPEALADLLRQAQEMCGTEPAKTSLLGISAGGALAATMAHLYPELIGAVATVAGPAPFAAVDMGSAMKAMRHGPESGKAKKIEAMARSSSFEKDAPSRMPILIVQGGADESVNPANAQLQEFSALVLNSALGMKAAQKVGKVGKATPVKREHDEGEWGSASLWTDWNGEMLATVARPKFLGHAWSGGKIGEPFAQDGFDQTRLALDFFKAARSGELDEMRPQALGRRMRR